MKKPFNLEEALAGKPVVTREGYKVEKIVSFTDVEIDSSHKVVYAFERCICFCRADGKQLNSDDEGYRDLFMEVEDEVLWINVYRNSSGRKYTGSFPTEEAADATCHERVNGKAYKIVLDGDPE